MSTVKPYLSLKKASSGQSKIILNENDEIISESQYVTKIFNDFFANVAEKNGTDYDFDPDNHPIIDKNKEKNTAY